MNNTIDESLSQEMLKNNGILFKEFPFFKDLSAEEQDFLKSRIRLKDFNKGEILFQEGRPCDRVFFVQTGRVKIFRTAFSGREQILEILEKGDTCGCHAGSCQWFCSASAEALSRSTVLFLSRQDFAKLLQMNPNLAYVLARLLSERLLHYRSLIEEVSLKDVKKRLVKFLLSMLKDKQGSASVQETLFIPFTRQEIAQRIGAARETVARQLYRLKRAKLIDIKPHQIVILKKEALEQLLLQ